MEKFEVINSFEKFLALKELWNELLNVSDDISFFNKYEWYLAWWKSMIDSGQIINPYIVIYYKDNILKGIAPMQIKDGLVVFLSSGPADYENFIIHQDSYNENLERIINYLMGKNMKIELNEVQSETRTYKFLLTLRDKRINITEASLCPYMRLDELDKGSKGFLKYAEIKLKKIQRTGNIEINHYYNQDEICVKLERFKSLFRDRWLENASSWFFFEKFDDIFFVNMSKYLTENKGIILSELTINGMGIGYYFGYIENKSYLFYRSAFDQEYSKYSPGHILLVDIIKMLKNEGYEELDFLRGAYTYKSKYTEKVRKNYNIRLI